MILLIGGYAQGKLTYAISKMPQAVVFDLAELSVAQCIDQSLGKEQIIWDHLELFVRKHPKETDELIDFFQKHADKDWIVISDEVGSGIIPIEKEERIWREEVGRVQIEFAKISKRVERIICGIAQIIK